MNVSKCDLDEMMTNKRVYTVTSLLLHIRIILLINHIRPMVSCKVYTL